MESIALFEEKIPITPKDLSRGAIQIEKLLEQKLAKKLEGKCSLHGYVVPGTTKLLSRSMGYVEKGRYTGDIVYHSQAEAKVVYPPDGTRRDCVVERKNKMGMYVNYKDAIHVILPRDLHIGEDARSIEFNDIQPGEVVQVEIKKSRFQVNDPYILSVGLYLGKSGQGVAVGGPEPFVEATLLPKGRAPTIAATTSMKTLDERRDVVVAIQKVFDGLTEKGLSTDTLPSTPRDGKIFYTIAFDMPAEKLKILDKEFEVLHFTPNGFAVSADEETYQRDKAKLDTLFAQYSSSAAETEESNEDSEEEEDE
jgi:hypothetical protein